MWAKAVEAPMCSFCEEQEDEHTVHVMHNGTQKMSEDDDCKHDTRTWCETCNLLYSTYQECKPRWTFKGLPETPQRSDSY